MLHEPGRSYEFLIEESVLRRQIVPPTILRAQLDRLLHDLELPSSRIGIIPQGARVKAIPWLSFQVFYGEDVEAGIELPTGPQFFPGSDAETFIRLLDRLWLDAVEGDDARQVIATARDALPIKG